MVMNDTDRICLICLEGAKEENPISLLDCGCKTSWFHQSCEDMWLSYIEHTITEYNNPKCPTCKREVSIQAKYIFLSQVGKNQEYLYNTLLLIGSECILSLSYMSFHAEQAWLIPIQSVCILSLPILFRTNKDLLFSMHNIRIKSLIQVLYMISYMVYNRQLIYFDPYQTSNNMVGIGFSYTIFLVFCMFIQAWYHDTIPVDPFRPFCTGYTLLHKQTLGVSQTIPSSLEGNEPLDRGTSIRRSLRVARRV